jgi:hypothetical protein
MAETISKLPTVTTTSAMTPPSLTDLTVGDRHQTANSRTSGPLPFPGKTAPALCVLPPDGD